MKRCFATILAVCTVLSVLTVPAGAAGGGETLRVGLYYGGSALPAPQLQNFEGSGYLAGYYGADDVFHSLLPLAQTKVVMLKDANYARAADNTYAETTAAPAVGAYHVQAAATYPDAAAAQAAASAAGGFVAYTGQYVVRTGSYPSLVAAQMAASPVGGTAVGGSPTGITVAATETSAILFEYDGGEAFAMAPQGAKPVTWSKGYKYYGNFVYPRESGKNLSVLNYVNVEDYVKGVIPYEMSADWNKEALKAQAICARSEALSEKKHAKLGFDVCATTDCQVYQGANRANANSDSAVDQTAGVVAMAGGKLAGLYYFSSDGGATEDAANVWGGNYSHLVGKADPYEAAAVPEKNAVWSVKMTAAQAGAKIKAVDASFGTLANLEVTKNTAVGNVLEVTATDTAGKKVVLTKAKCRGAFSLNSQRYTITRVGGAPAPSAAPKTVGEGIAAGFQRAAGAQGAAPAAGEASYEFRGTGWGHHVGMSQYGAKAMAEKGMTYEDILNFYFTGITLQKMK